MHLASRGADRHGRDRNPRLLRGRRRLGRLHLSCVAAACAFQALSLLKALDRIDVPAAVKHIHRCRNFDGGFGLAPHAESHAGQVFTCLGALSIVNQLHIPENKSWLDTCGLWLCERQLPMGGLNGRPEKLEDVCYSWWVLSSLKMVQRLNWIDRPALTKFILSAQVRMNSVTSSL